MEMQAPSVVVAGDRGAGPWLLEHVLRGFNAQPFTPAASPLTGPAVAIVAVSDRELAEQLHRLQKVLPADAGVVVVTAGSMAALEIAAQVEPRWQVCGLHMLFDIYRSGPSGQTMYLVDRSEDGDGATPPRSGWLSEWLTGVIEDAGGIVKTGSASLHDRTMSVVQALPHRMMVAFVDEVMRSGLHLEEELWAARTPLFEALLGLGVSVLDTRRENSLVAAQELPDAAADAHDYDAALQRFTAAAPGQLPEHLTEVREGLWAAAYDSLRRVGISTLTAIQSKREALAAYRTSGELLGLRTVTEAGGLRVGRVVETTPNEVTLEEMLVGPRVGPRCSRDREYATPGESASPGNRTAPPLRLRTSRC